MNKKILLLLSSAAFAAVPSSHAANIVFSPTGTTDNWANNVWSTATTGAPPTPADNALVRSGKTAEVTTSVGTVVGVLINNTGTATSTINVLSGGTLNATGSLVMGGSGATSNSFFNVTSGGSATFAGSSSSIGGTAQAGATGTVGITGGSFTSGTITIGNVGAGTMNVSAGTVTMGTTTLGVANTGSLNVSGGTVNLGATSVGTANTGSLSVSGGSVTVTSMSAVGGVANSTAGTGTLAISGTGNFTVSGASSDTYIGARVAGSSGTFTLSGGTAKFGDAGDGRILVGSTATGGVSVTGTATISGGTFIGRMMIGGASGGTPGSGSGTLNVVGSTATIGSTATTTGVEVRSTGAIVFTMDAAGISKLDYANSLFSIATGATVKLDITSYMGGTSFIGETTTLTLVDAGSLGSSLTSGSLNTFFSVIGTNANYSSVVFSMDSANSNINATFTSAVPEPSTWALLGLGAGFMAFSARRRFARKM